MKHLFIINPVAGGKKGRVYKVERAIRAFAESLDDPYEIYITKEPMDACRKVAQEAELTDNLRVYACGGDGTLNECANGAALRKNVAITHYPCGTGNDFIRTFGQENVSRFHDFRALINGTVRPLELIECNDRYGINICSVGIDARVGADVHKYSRIPIIGGATGYVVSLLLNVIKGVAQRFRITTEEGTQDRDITLACACNGRYYGGGFNPVPEALPDDGQLEYLIIKAVSRFEIASIVGKYAKGKYRELSNYISHRRGRRIEVESDRKFVVNIDGEIIHTKKICFNVVPKGVNFIFPAEI
jgi:YegS/Rv2252/BmrU family lipid kinase